MSRETTAGRPGLDRLQRWMQAVVVHPGTVEDAIASTDAAAEIPVESLDRVVRPSRSMSPAERVGVYQGMYLLRMEEALAADYPVIRHQLGDHRFRHLVRAYVERYPSRSYTLNRLGDHLPQYFLDEPSWPDAAFLHDLARLELAMTEVFDEEESSVLGPAELEAVAPEAWERARLRPIAPFRLLALRYAVIPHLVAYHEDRPAPAPRRRASRVALYRRDYAVRRLELDRAQHELLEALCSGTPLGGALSEAAARQRSARRQEQIFRWFRTWVGEGLFAAIET